jgi:microcystin degradation protein MlrC
MHANVSAALVGLGVMCFGFKTYPHIDMYDQGLRAAETMTRVIQEGVTLHQAFTRVPALLPSINMRTAAGPMKDLVDASQEAERRPNIVAASVFGGFPYSDTEVAGASVVVLGTTRADVTDAATRLAEQVWARREDFLVDLPDVSEAIDIARDGRADGPIVLADIADNPLSGGSADTTALIRAVIDGGLNSVLAGAICDRDVVDQARRAGRSAELTVELGGRSSPEFGAPLCLTVEVIAVSDGCFRNSGPMNTGIDVDVEGAAWLRAGQTDFLVTGRPITANDPALFAHLGIDVTGYRYLVLKVKNHFRAAFEPIVSSIISVDAPGVAANDLTILPFRRAHRDFWPFDRQRQFAAPATEVIAVPPALPEGGA